MPSERMVHPEDGGGREGGDGPVEVAFDVRPDGVGELTLRPRWGASIPLDAGTLEGIDDVLAEVEELAGAGSLRILVVRPAVHRASLPGYDLEELRTLRDDRIVRWSRWGQAVLRRLERLPIPTVAVIREDWLGGAAELALACSDRVAEDVAAARIGFPQTRLGFVPAWGGTVRLPRLVGLAVALDLIIAGEALHADQALEIGLIDRIFPSDAFDAQLERFLSRRAEGERPRGRRGRSVRSRLLDDTAPGRRLVVSRAARSHLGGRQDNLAGRIALDLVRETIDLPIEEAFAREAATAGELIVGTQAQGRLHSERLTERAARRAPTGAADLHAIAVVGAGETGSDLAHLLAAAGISTRIRDPVRGRARDAVDQVRARIGWEQDHGRISAAQARRRAARVEAVSGFGGFGTLDLVLVAPHGTGLGASDLVEAIEGHVREECLIGVVDWVTPPGRIQRHLRQPDRLFGFQPALPLDRFPLVEIAPGSLTSRSTVAAARRLARRLGLTAIVVPDAAPAPGVRLLAVFLAEAARLADQGADFVAVDEASRAFGFGLGPFQRIDAIGAPRLLAMLQALGAAVPSLGTPSAWLREVAAAGMPLYHYRAGRPAGPHPDLPAHLRGDADAAPPPDAAVRRIVLALVNEAARILEDGAADEPGDVDMLSIHGLGFPRERGGILFHAGDLGLDRVVAELNALAAGVGERFAPAGLLRDLALGGRAFFTPAPARDPAGHPPEGLIE